MKESVLVIGCGNTGNQITALAAEKGIEGIAINTSTRDLETVAGKVETIRLESINGDSLGAGKNRTNAKLYLQNSIMTLLANPAFRNPIASKETVFVVCSAGGGTGSGVSPILYTILKQTFPQTTFILVGVLCSAGEAKTAQFNSLEFLKEVSTIEGAVYMLYDNDSKSGMPLSNALSAVNEDVVEDILVLSGEYNYTTTHDSMDSADMEVLLNTPGRLVVGRLKGAKNPVDSGTLEAALLSRLKGSSNAPISKDTTIGCSAVIANISVDAAEFFDVRVPKIKEFVGAPECDFLHYHVHDLTLNDIYYVGAGLQMPVDRLQQMSDLVSTDTARKNEGAAQNIFDMLSFPSSAPSGRVKPANDRPASVNIGDTFDRFLGGDFSKFM